MFLLMFSTALDYFSALLIAQSDKHSNRKLWLWLSIGINLGFLGFFKYYNFFVESFREAAAGLGWQVDPFTIKVILPVGISFYTFHGLSYVIDVYYKRIQPERNPVDYALFVSFFPLLVAGPIERATHLLPQLKQLQQFDYAQAVSGLRQILWGLFKKVVIADNCAVYSNMIFNHQDDYSGSNLFVGALFFTFQIYGDFSGYSDIALGTARLFGIELLRNFAYPYFSRDIAEFWRRWHISLSSWFKDYLYIPLGGSKGGLSTRLRITFIIFLVSGFWHGANWTFIFWGALNAIYFLPLLILNLNRSNTDTIAEGRWFPSFKDFLSVTITFLMTVFAWIFFRAESLSKAFLFIKNMMSSQVCTVPSLLEKGHAVNILVWVIIMLLIEWTGRLQDFALRKMYGPRWFRWLIYLILLFIIFFYSGEEQQFIYFQF